MSYSIVYDKQFIKTNKYIIPMVLMGDNNVYDCTGRPARMERRSRDWCSMSGFVGTKEEFLSLIDKWCTRSSDEVHFMMNGKWVDNKRLRSFAKNSIKDAMPIELIHKLTYQGLNCEIVVWKDERKIYFNTYCRTTEELDKWIDEAKQKNVELQGYLSLSFSGSEPLKVPSGYGIKGKVCLKSKESYINEYSENSVGCSIEPNEALIFNSTKEALEAIPFMPHNRKCRFVSANTKPTEHKPKNYIIKISKGSYVGTFIKRLNSRSMSMSYGTSQAKRFVTVKEAEKYIKEKLKTRFPKNEYQVIYHEYIS